MQICAGFHTIDETVHWDVASESERIRPSGLRRRDLCKGHCVAATLRRPMLLGALQLG